MIGLVAVADVVMILVLVHAMHRTVSLTAQWPIAVLVLGVIGWGIRSFNVAGRRWVAVTAKQLTWAAGPGAVKSGFTASGSVKLADVTGVSVALDEFQVSEGRKKESSFRAYRLHAEIEGKPTIILPVIAVAPDESAPAAQQESDRARLLSVVEQIDAFSKKFTVDTTALGLEASSTEVVETDEAEVTQVESSDTDTDTEAKVETETEAEAEETEAQAAETTAVKAEISD